MAARTRKTATSVASKAAAAATTAQENGDLSFQNFLVELSELAAKYSNSVAADKTVADRRRA